MNEFILQKNSIQEIPAFLVTRVSGFSESAEYKELRDYELDIPGVVCGVFAKYLCKMHERRLEGHTDESVNSAISSAHEAIEVLASSPESTSRELVTDEIYENLDCKENVLEQIRSHLKPESRALYQRWND